jgi:hypothetical protein
MVINARLCIVQLVFGDANSSFLFPKALVQSGSKKSRIFSCLHRCLGKTPRSFEIAGNVLFRVVGRTHQH